MPDRQEYACVSSRFTKHLQPSLWMVGIKRAGPSSRALASNITLPACLLLDYPSPSQVPYHEYIMQTLIITFLLFPASGTHSRNGSTCFVTETRLSGQGLEDEHVGNCLMLSSRAHGSTSSPTLSHILYASKVPPSAVFSISDLILVAAQPEAITVAWRILETCITTSLLCRVFLLLFPWRNPRLLHPPTLATSPLQDSPCHAAPASERLGDDLPPPSLSSKLAGACKLRDTPRHSLHACPRHLLFSASPWPRLSRRPNHIAPISICRSAPGPSIRPNTPTTSRPSTASANSSSP